MEHVHLPVLQIIAMEQSLPAGVLVCRTQVSSGLVFTSSQTKVIQIVLTMASAASMVAPTHVLMTHQHQHHRVCFVTKTSQQSS